MSFRDGSNYKWRQWIIQKSYFWRSDEEKLSYRRKKEKKKKQKQKWAGPKYPGGRGVGNTGNDTLKMCV